MYEYLFAYFIEGKRIRFNEEPYVAESSYFCR